MITVGNSENVPSTSYFELNIERYINGQEALLNRLICIVTKYTIELILTFFSQTGFNPVWDEELIFPLSCPELAFVRFTVWDQDPIGRDFIGQRTLTMGSLKQGIKIIPLYQC